MAATAIDTAYLAGFSGFPQPNIESLIQSPTTDLVTSFLQSIIVKAQDYEDTKSEQRRLEVELENAVHSGETRAKGLKTNADKALADVDSLRRKLNDEENARRSLDGELQTLKSSTSASSVEVDSLRAKITKLESSGRETLALLDSKNTAHDQIATELSAQQSSAASLRREVSALQERVREAENDRNSSQFRESSLQREIAMLKKNNDWLSTELQTKSGDYTKFRKEKTARVAELQRANDEAESNLASARRTEAALRQRLEEMSQKLNDSFDRIKQLQDDANASESAFLAQLDRQRRLTDLQEESAKTSKLRVQELEEQCEQTKEDASQELGQMQAELETERQAKEASEQKIEALETQVERLEAVAAENPPAAFSRPATPSARSRIFHTPRRGASPSPAPPGSARGGLTVTQLYSELSQTKTALDEEKRKNGKLTAHVDELMEDMEQRLPEMEETAHEKEELQSQLETIASTLDEVRQERDGFRKDHRQAQGEIVGLQRQDKLVRQQVRDREAQLRYLAFLVSLHEEGNEPNELQREQLERMATGNLNELAAASLTDTDRFISERLVTFRSIADLTATNAKLLDLTRQLGQQMEGEEAKAKQNHQQQLESSIKRLQDENDQLRLQVETIITQSNSFVKERDMFRRLLENTRRLPANTNVEAFLRQSANGSETPRTPRFDASVANGEQSPASKDHAEQMKLIKDLQAHFDAYKREAATDHTTLRSQADTLSKDKLELQGEIARTKSQLSLAQERYDMLQANFNLLKTENEELQKRARSLEETNTKQELRGQQVAEELVQSQELSEGLRTENANLKAEKELYKRIEARLNEDNQALSEERTRLNKLVADTQSLSNQRETTDSETRRSLRAQVDSLDMELRSTKQKLDDEVTDARQASKRRELEQEQSRARQDDLVASLGNTKEELIAAKTTRDQLQARVEELRIELRNAQERAEALQPRPTPRTTALAATEQSANNEQELLIQIADAKRDLDLSKGELENAHSQVEQYKAIAQSSEEALNSLQESQTQYSEDMEKVLGEKEDEIRQLEQRVQDISNELSETTHQLHEAQTSSNEFTSRLELQKATYEEEIARVKDECERQRETAKLHQQDLRAQASIAQSAQQSYENELVKHAEAAKTLTSVREEFNKVKLELSTTAAHGEAARASLVQSEESWASSRESYEREMSEAKRNRDDLNNQNKLLHQQLESVSTQIAELQQKRATTADAHESAEHTDSSLQNLQEVIKYLRREKEIVDVQYELLIQESSRLKQQLSYAQTQLDEARLKLDQERKRHSDSERTSQSHAKMVETLNEINVYRESNASLRAESTRVRAQLEAESKKAQNLQNQIEPLNGSIRELENQLETAQGEHKLLQEDRDRWQKRTQDILQKYDRVDPAELEDLKSQLGTARQERDEAVSSKSTLEESITTQITAAKKETKDSLMDQLKERSKALSVRIKAAEEETVAVRTRLTDELQAVQSQLESTKKEKDEAVAASQAAKSAQQAEEGEVSALEEQRQASRESAAKAETLQARVTELEKTTQNLQARATELQTQVESRDADIAALRTNASQTQQSASTSQDRPHDGNHLQKVQAELDTTRAQLHALRESSAQEAAQQESAPSPALPTDSSTDVESLKTRLEENYTKKVTSMRNQLNDKLKQGRERNEAEKQELQAKLEEIETNHKAEVETLRREHEQALGELDAIKAREQQPIKSDPAAQGAPSVDTDTPMADSNNSDAQFWTNVGNWGNEEVNRFMSLNENFRKLVGRNITKKVQAREEELAETHTAQIEEIKTKAEKSSEARIEMETKKVKLKTNLLEGRLKASNVKIEYVSKAADETPQKAVLEVWTVAKDLKAPPASAATPSNNAAQTPVPPTPKTPTPAQQPATEPIAAESQASAQTTGPVSGIPQRRGSQVGERPLTKPPSRPSSRQGQRPSEANNAAKPGAQGASSSIPQPSLRGGAGRGTRGDSATAGTKRLPDGPLGGEQNGAGQRGRGGARGSRQSSGAGRGFGFNPGAGQFTPQAQGAKRPRDDSDGPGTGRAGKYARGN